MSDDEEVVLRTSELQRYLNENNIDGITSDSASELNSSNANETDYLNSQILKPLEDVKFNYSYKKPELSWHTSCMIDTILKTGLMYTDHVADIELYLSPSSIKHNYFKSSLVFYSTFFLSSVASVAVLCKKIKTLRYISIFSVSFLGIYKIYDDLLLLCTRKKVKRFASAIERLFFITKRALSFVFESEFLLKTKIIKEQPVYLSNSSSGNASNPDGSKYSCLLLPEFRNILGKVFLNVIINFDNLCKYLRTKINLLPCVDCDSNCIELPYASTLLEISTDPSWEDLKKLNSMYLIGQSEFLRRLTLTFVKDFWVKRDSDNALKSIIEKLDNSASTLLHYVDTLESYYESHLKINKNRSMQIERNKVLKAKDANERLFIFVKQLLTKADAHILSLSVDLKMLESWIEECEKSNRNNDVDCKKIFMTLLDRLSAVKSNSELFNCLLIDNYNILKNMINDDEFNDVSNTVLKSDIKSNECVQKTGIEVGRSDFNIPGEDEVLISLCNPNVSINDDKSLSNDYEDEEIQKCLPKNVLLELKCALKGKKDEWIEREKKALKSDVTMDVLDLDTLSKTAESYKDTCLPKSNPCKTHSRHSKNDNYASESSSGEEESYVCSNNNTSNRLRDVNKSIPLISTPKNYGRSENDPQSDIEANYSNESIDSSEETNFNRPKNNICSFMDQIKSAQKSFNLNMKEEEFIDECDD